MFMSLGVISRLPTRGISSARRVIMSFCLSSGKSDRLRLRCGFSVACVRRADRNEDYSDLEVRVGFELTRAAAGIADCHQALIEARMKVRFGRMPLQRKRSDGRAFKPAQLLVAHTSVSR